MMLDRFFRTSLAGYLIFVSNGVAQNASTDVATVSPVLESTTKSVQELLACSSQDLANGDLEKALRHVDAALVLDAHNAPAYDQRASIYVEEKLWDLAEGDYRSAAKNDPANTVYKYKLGEIQFQQKLYDEARPHFAELQGDGPLGELAAYKVLLCDLFTAHEARATQDLAGINRVGAGPSYYFGNAAWAWAHNQGVEANKWIGSAAQIYDSATMKRYFSSLQRFSPAVVSFTAKSGTPYVNAAAVMEAKGLRVCGDDGVWTTVPLDQLPDDLSPFPVEMRVQIVDARRTDPGPSPVRSLVSFTTRQGKHYQQVQWRVDQAGVRVLTTDGWVTVPFAQLPDELPDFPAEMQEKIATRHKFAMVATDVPSAVSFTSKQGKSFAHVRANLSQDGLRVLTGNGWLTVPFRELPDDLSPFPPDWHERIKAGTTGISESLVLERVVNFTTRKGKIFNQVKTTMADDGLRVLTPNGWVLIAFQQLPDDLSGFPEKWRPRIAEKQHILAAQTGWTGRITTR